MDKNIVIVGGDKRNLYLFKLLKEDNYRVNYIEQYIQLNEVDKANIIIGPTPFSKDGENVYIENIENKIAIMDLLRYCYGKKLVAGAISKDIKQFAINNNIEVIDLMQDEGLTVLNTIATAEGAIEVAMRKTETTIQGSNVLILGFGRVGKVVAQKFAALFANVTCAARKKEAFAWIQVNGYKCININTIENKLDEFDIIVNTPPVLILDKERLKRLKKDCLVIDLASRPGGVDRAAIKELGINFEWALGLPGKAAPITAAKHFKNALEPFLN